MMLKFDAKQGLSSQPYFYTQMVAYELGLVTTVGIMHFFDAAQPALLYLVPACIGSALLTAVWRGELATLLSYRWPAPAPPLSCTIPRKALCVRKSSHTMMQTPHTARRRPRTGATARPKRKTRRRQRRGKTSDQRLLPRVVESASLQYTRFNTRLSCTVVFGSRSTRGERFSVVVWGVVNARRTARSSLVNIILFFLHK